MLQYEATIILQPIVKIYLQIVDKKMNVKKPTIILNVK